MHTTHSVHAGIQKPLSSRLPQPFVVFSFCHDLSRPFNSLIWAQLTLFVSAMGVLAPLSQDGVPIHRVRTPTPPGVRYRIYRYSTVGVCSIFLRVDRSINEIYNLTALFSTKVFYKKYVFINYWHFLCSHLFNKVGQFLKKYTFVRNWLFSENMLYSSKD